MAVPIYGKGLGGGGGAGGDGGTDWSVLGVETKGNDRRWTFTCGIRCVCHRDGDWRDATTVCIADSNFGGDSDFAGEPEKQGGRGCFNCDAFGRGAGGGDFGDIGDKGGEYRY